MSNSPPNNQPGDKATSDARTLLDELNGSGWVPSRKDFATVFELHAIRDNAIRDKITLDAGYTDKLTNAIKVAERSDRKIKESDENARKRKAKKGLLWDGTNTSAGISQRLPDRDTDADRESEGMGSWGIHHGGRANRSKVSSRKHARPDHRLSKKRKTSKKRKLSKKKKKKTKTKRRRQRR